MNMPKPPSDIEAYVRRLFAPDAVTVERVLTRVFRSPSHGLRRRRRWAWAVAALATVLLSATSVWRWRQPAQSGRDESSWSVTGDAALVVVERADGRRWVVLTTADGAAAGNYVIVMER